MRAIYFTVLLFVCVFSYAASLDTSTSGVNSTSTPLASGGSFIGPAELMDSRPGVLTSVLSDRDGTLYMEFSPDGTNWDSSLSFNVIANTNEVHRFTTSKKYYRTRFLNSSTQDQTFIRLQTSYGPHQLLTSALNTAVQQDADAIVVKAITEELAVVQGLFQNVSIVNKFGTNSDVDTGSVPEDVWEGGGVYTGFPDTACETMTITSSSASDAAAGTGARTVRVTGLDCSYNQYSETVTLNGVGNVTTTGSFRRAHTASVQSAGSGGVNAGVITFKHSISTSNIFLSMVVGRNQTNCGAYTVPAGYTAYMRSFSISINQGTATASATGYIWTRAFGNPFRSRRPFLVNNSFVLNDKIYGGLVFTEKSDISLRIDSVSNNNTLVTGGFDLILVKN